MSSINKRKRSASTVGDVGRSVKRLSRPVAETKYFDTTFAATIASAADWTGTEVPMTSYIQSDGTTVGSYTDSALIPSAIGSGYGQVVGNKYRLKSLRVRGEVLPAVAADQADVPQMGVVRIVLVHDTQPNGAQAQGEDVFTDLGSAAQCNYSFLAMGAGSGGRFRILKDKWVRLQPAATGTDGTNTNSVVRSGGNFTFQYTPKKPLAVVVKSGTSTPAIAGLSNTNVFMLAHLSQASGGTATLVGACRAYYDDN